MKAGTPMTARRPDGLTERQAEVMRWVAAYTAAEGMPPTVRQVMRAIGATSSNGAHAHLQALARKGWLVAHGEGLYCRYRPAGLRLVPEYEDTPDGRRLFALMTEEPEQE
jgi:SOS-response transcriptional repressor LexA